MPLLRLCVRCRCVLGVTPCDRLGLDFAWCSEECKAIAAYECAIMDPESPCCMGVTEIQKEVDKTTVAR